MKSMAKIVALMFVLSIAVGALVVGTARAGPGPKVLWGYVYDSDGELVTDSSTVKVVVKHGLSEESFEGVVYSNGTWSVTIGTDGWNQGDTITIWIDGTPWGDANYKVHDYETKDRTSWTLNIAGSEQLNVQTYKEIPSNFKPIFALIFFIILLLTGLLFVSLLNSQTVDLAVTDKKMVTVKRGDRVEKFFTYKCSYGTPKNLIEIGEVERTKVDVPENTVQRVKVGRILKDVEGNYILHKPKLLHLPKVKKVLAGADVVNEKWFLGGHLQLREGQTSGSAVFRYKGWMTVALTLPFLFLEALFGLWSLTSGELSIPPWLGWGLILNLIVLVVGIIVHLLAYWHPRKLTPTQKRKPEVVAKPPATKKEEEVEEAVEEVEEVPEEEEAPPEEEEAPAEEEVVEEEEKLPPPPTD